MNGVGTFGRTMRLRVSNWEPPLDRSGLAPQRESAEWHVWGEFTRPDRVYGVALTLRTDANGEPRVFMLTLPRIERRWGGLLER